MGMIEISLRMGKQGLAALGILAGLALAPTPAQAQVCAEPDEIADELLDEYIDQFEDFFPLSKKTCESMAKTFYKACNTAVKDSVKCADHAVGSIPKAAKPGCKEASMVPSECNQFFKNQAEAINDFVEALAELAYDDCIDAAETFSDICEFPF
jgi:hypothetical protein